MGVLAQTGAETRIDLGPEWLHGSVELSQWPSDTPQMFKSAPYGDRRQELVFIGRGLNEAEIRRKLELALLTDSEFQSGIEEWSNWHNPLLIQVDEADGAEEADEADEAEHAGTIQMETDQKEAHKDGPGEKTLEVKGNTDIPIRSGTAQKRVGGGGKIEKVTSSDVGCSTSSPAHIRKKTKSSGKGGYS